MYLEKRELDQVVGGASASFFNSVARILRMILVIVLVHLYEDYFLEIYAKYKKA